MIYDYSEGMPWIAAPRGMNVTRWDPKTGKKLMQITLPVIKPTSYCFGGLNFAILYVTTAIYNASLDELTEYPLSGSIFAVTGLDITGLLPCTSMQIVINCVDFIN